MTVYQWVVIIAAVCLCIAGIMTLLDVPFMTKGMKQKYTDESVKSYCKKTWVCYVLMAAGAVMESIVKYGTALYYVSWGLVMAGVVFPIFFSKSLQSK